MTKRRPSNKKPTGLNKSLGNSLSNDREKTRKSHQRAKWDGNDIENPAFMEHEVNHYIDSVTDETSLEEFLAKAELAGTEFTAEKEQFKIIEKNSAIVVPTRVDYRANLELQKENEHRLRIPRRPAKELWENMEELTKLENEAFLQWRSAMDDALEVIAEDGEEAAIPSTSTTNMFVTNKDELIAKFKELGHVSDEPSAKPVMVGMVGYPNVGKSSTINKLAGGKKVSVSATPGKTRHFQTIHIDSQLCLCDCPGLVMPSFSFGRSEMFLNGILPIDQMRDHFGPTSLLLSRVPVHVIEAMYSIMLPEMTNPSAINLLNSLAFMRGFMASSGIPDCSRAARLMFKDVVSGKLMWAAAPPGEDQEEFDRLSYPEKKNRDIGRVQMEKLAKLQLLEGDEVKGSQFDSQHFAGSVGVAHVRDSKALPQRLLTVVPTAPVAVNGKKHYKGKKDKLRRIYNE
ncbi:hypothetical protein CAEBREN_21438 [Caenorhabditis brenneri]|uniref:Large subunit GTPase 1 homolog n=1 Tax=Caenorhabditis brenneri TaxID=135651 RepID=G0P5J4_CAEBE|nr:hypothetical protein CAEBREN_21438 [Caenorhabditis brenneri]